MDDPFVMTTDINGKPIPRWQEQLEGMYTDGVPFGEILSLVRHLLEERDIDTILSAPDDVVLADLRKRGGDPEQFAAEMRQKFDVIARLTRDADDLRTALAATSAALEEALHWRAIAEDSARVCEGLRRLARDVTRYPMAFNDHIVYIPRAAFERLRDAVGEE